MIDPRMMQAAMPQPPMPFPGMGMMQEPQAPANPFDLAGLMAPFAEDLLKEKAPPKPDLNQVLLDAIRDQDFFLPQKDRMWLDDKLYQMDDPYRDDRVKVDPGTEDVAELVSLNDLRVIADKFGNRIGRTEPILQVPCKDIDDDKDAQEIENYLRWTWKLWSQLHILSGGKMPLLRQEVMSAVVRGWICYRVWYDPSDEDAPFLLDLFDPMYVYPKFNKRGLTRVLVIRDMTLREVLDNYPEFEEAILKKYGDDTDPEWWVSTIAYYDRYYHGFIMQNDWVKPPTPHGMGVCPWICVPNQGGIFEAPCGEGGSNDWTKYYGDSIYASLRDPFKTLVRLYSALMVQVAKDANSPVIITTRNGNISASDISTGIGAVNVVNDPDAKVQAFGQSQRPGLIEAAVGGVKSGMSKGSMPDIMWGHDINTQSGLARSMLAASGEDVFSPIINSVQIARAAVSKVILEVAKKHEVVAPMVATRQGVRVQGQRFSYESVVSNGTYVEFSFKSLTPQDMIAMGTLVVNLVRAGILSMETVMGDQFLALEDPSLETNRKIKEKALYDPRVMEILMDFAMSQDPDDPLAQAWQQKKLEEKMAMLQGASNAGGRQLLDGRQSLQQPGNGKPVQGGQMEGQEGTNAMPRQMMEGTPNPTLNMANMANADMNTQG